MEPVIPFDWHRLFIGPEPFFYLFEIVLRVLIIYFFSLIILRVAGKRSHQQTTPLELILLIALGSAVGDVLFYPEVPILYTVIVFITMVVLQRVTARLKLKSPVLEDVINSRARLIVRDGQVITDALTEEDISLDELYSGLRQQGVKNIGHVEYAFLELSGNYSVFFYEKGAEKNGEDIILPLL